MVLSTIKENRFHKGIISNIRNNCSLARFSLSRNSRPFGVPSLLAPVGRCRQDIQNDAIKSRIQSFMISRGFPEQWADDEYSTYFEKIFGDDKERQRKYLTGKLSENNVTLSIGNRVLGAFIASGLCRAVFTTNFDSVVEKAVAEVSGKSLSAYHIEGSHVANQALNNEEYPIYCKLHGDFRYDSLKNLPDDLASQNDELSKCLINAGNRFGFIVSGYSGRDKSVMELFHKALETNNPFPHGLLWTGKRSSPIHPAVETLLDDAKKKGVNAHYVPIETFDAFLLRLWRNVEEKPMDLDAKVRKSTYATVNIPLPCAGNTAPILRMNALPILDTPSNCLELSFSRPIEWEALREARAKSRGRLMLTKSDSILCWGTRKNVNDIFGGEELLSIQTYELPTNISSPGNLKIKGFIEEALRTALARDKPLLSRTTKASSFLIANPHADNPSDLDPLFDVIGKESGVIPGLYTPVTDEHTTSEEVSWAEAVRVSIDVRNENTWLLIDPDIWIWPPRARKLAIDFMYERRKDRRNDMYNSLLDAWIRVILATNERHSTVTVSALDNGDVDENPTFTVGTRTAYSRRLTK